MQFWLTFVENTGCAHDLIITASTGLGPPGKNHDAPQPVLTLPVPFYGDIPAGPPCDLQEAPETYPILAHLATPARYVLRVSGDSMSEQIRPGDLVLVEHAEGLPLDQYHNHVCAVLVDGERTLKRVQINVAGAETWIYLKGDRPDYPTQTIQPEREDFRILGRVLKIVDRNVM